MENLESLLNFIIKELVETKDKVNVTYEVLDSNVTFKVSVAKGEMGKIIGKNGLTANAIRGVMQAAGVKDKLNVNVEFLDDYKDHDGDYKDHDIDYKDDDDK